MKAKPNNYGVHVTHCCQTHGCKYGEDETCPISTMKEIGMTGKCMTCWIEEDNDGTDREYTRVKCPSCGKEYPIYSWTKRVITCPCGTRSLLKKTMKEFV